MSTHAAPVDISNNPELIRLAEKVRMTRESLPLKKDDETIAVLVPVTLEKKATPIFPKKRKADSEAFMSSAGGWKDTDVQRIQKASKVIEAKRKRAKGKIDYKALINYGREL